MFLSLIEKTFQTGYSYLVFITSISCFMINMEQDFSHSKNASVRLKAKQIPTKIIQGGVHES
jgi:hypothetical protein